jgi:hypothetical protein
MIGFQSILYPQFVLILQSINNVNEHNYHRVLRHLSGAPAGAGRAECARAGSKPVASALTLYIYYLLARPPSIAQKGWRPVSTFHLTSRFFAEAVLFLALYTAPSAYTRASYLPAYSATLLPHSLAQLLLARPPLYYSLPSEVRSLMRCSLYTPLPCLIQHASAHCICSTLSPDAATLSHLFFVCLSQLYLLLLSSLSHAILALQVIIESDTVRCTAAQTRRRSSS